MKALTFRLKIALLSALVSGLVLVGFGSVSLYVIYRQRVEAVDREIRTLSSRHPGWFANRSNYERLTSMLEFTFGEDRKDHVILMIRDAAGHALYRSPYWPEDLVVEKLDLSLRDNPKAARFTNAADTNREVVPHLGAPWGPAGAEANRGMGRGRGMGWGGPPQVTLTKVPRYFTVKTAGSTWRLGVLGNNETTLVVGINYDEVRGELVHVRDAFLLILPAALFLVGLGGWLVAGRALRPLKTIAETAENVTASGLDQRIPLSDEDPEIARVIRILNRMMDRLEASFRQATRFSADASHELKTPLAIMQGELENALQSAEPGSREQLIFSNLIEETQRLKTITRSLLLLAQADAGQLQLSLERLNLSEALNEILEDVRILAADSQLHFEVQVQPSLLVEADRTLLHTVLFNLLNNAVKYSEPDGRITVRLESTDNRATVAVGNTGPGIPAAEQSRVFERFHRIGVSGNRRVEGLGLGLSLSREIARAHHSELVLQESRPGWTCFTLTMNLAQRG